MARKKKEIFPPEHCTSVRDYERSPYWRKKSQTLLDDKETVCAICGRPRWTWQPRNKKWKKRRFSVHHISYKNCPNEEREDLMFLCSLEHTDAHHILQCRGVSQMFQELADIVRKYFFYDGIDTFVPW